VNANIFSWRNNLFVWVFIRNGAQSDHCDVPQSDYGMIVFTEHVPANGKLVYKRLTFK